MEASVIRETAEIFAFIVALFAIPAALGYATRWLSTRGTNYNGTFVMSSYDYGETWVEVAKNGNVQRLTLNVQHAMMPFGNKFWLLQQVWESAKTQVAERNQGALVNIQLCGVNYQFT